MSGENNLSVLLRHACPEHHPGKYIFTTLASPPVELRELAVMTMREEEGVTLILPQQIADQYEIGYEYVASWITLKIHSSLAAVGLTAAFSRALAEKGISCNVVAGYYHDHIFVATGDAETAIKTLSSLG